MVSQHVFTNSEIIIDTQPIAPIEAIYVFQTTFSIR